VIGRAMDAALMGHQFAKAAIDLACRDILGKAAGLPVHTLLGGRIAIDVPLHRVVPLGGAEETVAAVADIGRAIAENACDATAIKTSRLGGLTPARVVRDICADAGIALTIEDSWGGSIVMAAIAHLALSTPP